MSVNTKMTAIADEIRTLSGTTEAMGLDAMATKVGNANSEIDSQADLLSQIVTAFEGKTAVSGEDVTEEVNVYTGLNAELLGVVNSLSDAGNLEIQTCNLTITLRVLYMLEIGYTVFENGKLSVKTLAENLSGAYTTTTVVLQNVACNTAIVIRDNHAYGAKLKVTASSNVSLVASTINPTSTNLHVIECTEGGEGFITLTQETSGYE